MTQAAKKLLEEFDALQQDDRAEVLAELLRRVALAPPDLPYSDVTDWLDHGSFQPVTLLSLLWVCRSDTATRS